MRAGQAPKTFSRLPVAVMLVTLLSIGSSYCGEIRV